MRNYKKPGKQENPTVRRRAKSFMRVVAEVERVTADTQAMIAELLRQRKMEPQRREVQVLLEVPQEADSQEEQSAPKITKSN